MVTTLQKAFGQYLHTLFLGHIYTCYSITITRSFLKSFLKEHNNIDLVIEKKERGFKLLSLIKISILITNI